MDCTGVYDTDGNLTNVTMSAEKKAEILSYDFTGSGTASAPYQINTTNGFWYMSKFVNITSKYVELNCDVILNDEKFDENGNASGGDGVVYTWRDFYPYNTIINGNFHTIYGAYKNAHSVLGGDKVKKLENLNVANIYFIGSKIGGVCYGADYISNCEAKSGYIHNTSTGGTECAGVVVEAKEVVNCNNYVTLLSSGNNINAGIVYSSKKVINCKNFGDVLGDSSTYISSGIVGADGDLVIIEECENYGRFVGRNTGAVCACSWGNIIVKNFKNYDESWLFGWCQGQIQITNIITYGNGLLLHVPPNTTSNITIIGCVIYSKNYSSIIYTINQNNNGLIKINNIEVYAENIHTAGYGECCLINGNNWNNNITLEVQNIWFHIKNSENLRIKLIDYGTTSAVFFKNIYLDIQQNNKWSGGIIAVYGADKIYTNGIICNVKYDGGEVKFYYGDVSGFAQNWRTGEIVFRGRDSLGLFYSVLNDEIMSTMGFEKK